METWAFMAAPSLAHEVIREQLVYRRRPQVAAVRPHITDFKLGRTAIFGYTRRSSF